MDPEALSVTSEDVSSVVVDKLSPEEEPVKEYSESQSQ